MIRRPDLASAILGQAFNGPYLIRQPGAVHDPDAALNLPALHS